MGFEVIDFGYDLGNLLNYSKGSLCSLSEIAEQTINGKNYIGNTPLNAATIIYIQKNHFKVVPRFDFRQIRPPRPHSLVVPDYDIVTGSKVEEFVIVSPTDTLDQVDYAVMEQDYDPREIYTTGNLRYKGSPLGTPLKKEDARNHRVLVAAFGGDKSSLKIFLETMENISWGDFHVKVDISREDGSYLFATPTLQRFKANNRETLVIRAKDMGRESLFNDGKG